MPDVGTNQAHEGGRERRERPETAAPERTVALAVERLSLGSLRIVLTLTALSALSDTVLSALDGASAALVLAGAVTVALALAGVLYPHHAANLLRPRGRIVLVAVLFSLFGAVEPGLQSRYEEMPIACLATVLALPGWVAACVAVLAAGMIVDPLASGHTLAWTLTGPGQYALVNELVVLCATAGLTLGAISALRRTIIGAPASLAAVHHDGPSLTPQLAAAAAGMPVGLLARADPRALIAQLSAAERRLLALLVDGLAPKQAAHALGVKLPTVRPQIAAAKRKTGARTLEQLVGIYAEADGER